MKIESDLPQDVRQIEHLEIPMPDGTRLAARIWLPANAETDPVPAILEYIPYRKNDKTLERDFARAPWLAARGYAYVRVDLRGCGESEGVMRDEYTETELQDGCDVIAWIAEQVWCEGGVGIVGISWGGFNGLQLAALRPPALKAVVTICSTDDRYADDVHYMGGTLLVDQLSWASVMFGINTLPPDPVHVGDRWREMWEERLDGSGLWLDTWMHHQHRDDYWRHGSVCENYADIEVPVYAVSGWADGYCRAVFRLVENLPGPAKGIVGPWAHRYPYLGVPGPAIDWLAEEIRWWDQWLKGRDTGIMDEPPLRLFMQDHAEPKTHYATRAGHWITEPSWPSPNTARTEYAPYPDGSLVLGGAAEGVAEIASPLWVGSHGGKWCSYAHPGDQPGDQRHDDAGSLTFETAALDRGVEMAGDPWLDLAFEVDRPVAQVAVRLSDVAPNGTATRVSWGVLNLTHREGHDRPAPLEPGRRYRVRVPMKHVAQRFRGGHRVRVSLSTSYFPLCWPAPEPVWMRVHLDGTRLNLPIRDPGLRPAEAYGPPRAAPLLPQTLDTPPQSEWSVSQDMATGRVTIHVRDHEGGAHIDGHGLFHSAEGVETYTVLPDDPLSATGEVTWIHVMRREGWEVWTVTTTRLFADATAFRIEASLRASVDGETVRDVTWSERVPRNLL